MKKTLFPGDFESAPCLKNYEKEFSGSYFRNKIKFRVRGNDLTQKRRRPRFGSVRLRFGDGTVQAVLVLGSGGSSAKRVFRCFSRV